MGIAGCAALRALHASHGTAGSAHATQVHAPVCRLVVERMETTGNSSSENGDSAVPQALTVSVPLWMLPEPQRKVSEGLPAKSVQVPLTLLSTAQGVLKVPEGDS